MMKVVSPAPVQSDAAVIGVGNESRIVAIILGNDKSPSCLRYVCHLGEHVDIRAVLNRMGCIEPESVDVKLVHPVGDVLDEELANGRSLKIERRSPWGLMRSMKVGGVKCTQIIAVRTEMVINHIQDDR